MSIFKVIGLFILFIPILCRWSFFGIESRTPRASAVPLSRCPRNRSTKKIGTCDARQPCSIPLTISSAQPLQYQCAKGYEDFDFLHESLKIINKAYIFLISSKLNIIFQGCWEIDRMPMWTVVCMTLQWIDSGAISWLRLSSLTNSCLLWQPCYWGPFLSFVMSCKCMLATSNSLRCSNLASGRCGIQTLIQSYRHCCRALSFRARIFNSNACALLSSLFYFEKYYLVVIDMKYF